MCDAGTQIRSRNHSGSGNSFPLANANILGPESVVSGMPSFPHTSWTFGEERKRRHICVVCWPGCGEELGHGAHIHLLNFDGRFDWGPGTEACIAVG